MVNTIDDLVAVVAKVTVNKNNSPVGTASGFFYINNDNLFFITNRHVIIDEKKNFYPDSISLFLHNDPNNLKKNANFEIPLYDEKQPLWREHPTHGSKIDIVAIPIQKNEIESSFFIKAISKQNFLPNDIVIPLGQDVTVMGFPKGFHDNVHNLPLLRDATMASIYPIPFQGNPFILIDSHLHKGTSGSPVFTKPMNMVQKTDGSTAIMTGSPRYFVGIHSGSIDIKTDEDPLGLNCVWFPSLIEELTQ